MNFFLSTGEIVECKSGPEQSGAEGDIYLSLDGKSIVKIYHVAEANRRQSLESIIGRYNAVRDGSFWKEYYCWPDGVIVQPKLGVKMPRAPESLRNLDWLLLPKARQKIAVNELGNWAGHIGIAIRLSRAMRRLHMLGLCHSDLSRKNCLVNPSTGEIKLIDLDGLVVPGILPARVSGTPEFIAPEIICTNAKPSIYTDLHSLAVLLYQILLFRHPLKGPKIHSINPEEDDRLAFGEKALYIENTKDKSNKPRHQFVSSDILGNLLYELMQKAFVSGLTNPNERPQAAEWESALIRLNDSVLPCMNPSCPGKYFPYRGQTKVTCPWCNTLWNPFKTLMILDLYRPVSGRRGQYISDDYLIPSYPGRNLSEYHIYPDRTPGPNSDLHPKISFSYESKKNQWYINNLGTEKIKILKPDNSSNEVLTSHQYSLEDGIRIILGEGPSARLALVRSVELN